MANINELTFEKAHQHIKRLSYYKSAVQSEENKLWLKAVTQKKKDGKAFGHLFDLHKSKNPGDTRPELRIRSKNKSKKGRKVSGNIVSIAEKVYLLHEPKGVSDPTNKPKLTDPVMFNQKEYSSFLIDEDLVDKLARYHLSRSHDKSTPAANDEGNGQSLDHSDKKRRSTWIKSLQRDGQSRFRNSLLQKYDTTCCITGCKTKIAIEAAHLKPVAEQGNDNTGNGILLRVDMHRIFDAGFLAICPKNHTIHFSKFLQEEYNNLHNSKLRYNLSLDNSGKAALKNRWEDFTTI